MAGSSKKRSRPSSRVRRLSAGRPIDLDSWVLHAIPFWQGLPREMRVVLGVLSAYVDEVEAMSDLGIDAEKVEGHDLYEDWKGAVDRYLTEGNYGDRPAGASYGSGWKQAKHVGVHEVMGLLMWEHSFISGARVLLGNGGAEDMRLAKEAGHTMSLLSEALRVEEALGGERGSSGEMIVAGGTGLATRPD